MEGSARVDHGGFDTLRSDVPGIAWPPLSEGTGALLQSYVARLGQSEWLPAAEIARHQRGQLALLAQHCVAHSPHFAARMRQAGLVPGDLAQPGGLQRLPPLSRRELQSAPDVFCQQVPDRHQPSGLSQTSGSTGEPVTVRRTALNRLGWMAMTVRDHQWQNRDAGLRLAAMSAHNHAVRALPDWGSPLALLYRTGPALSLPAAIDVAELHARLIDFSPQLLVIYPTMLAALIDEIDRTGLRLDDLRHIRCMSEMVRPELRRRCEEMFGLRLEDAYTSQECGFIALQCPTGPGYHVLAETHLVEIIDAAGLACAPGETGRVLVTDLHNFATPLIRYDIGDYAVAGALCPCGRGLPTIERISGRERNLLRLPDGTRYWPLTGYGLFREIAPVIQYQLIQHDLLRVEVRLAVERGLSDAEEAALAAQIAKALGHPFGIEFTYYRNKLPPAPSGKSEEFVCLM